jgi:hypothetical protein
MSPHQTQPKHTKFERNAKAVLDHLLAQGFEFQFPRAKLAEAIRAATPYWRHDHVGAFIRAMEARGWIMPTAGGFYTWGPRAEEWKPKPAAEVVRAVLPTEGEGE